MSLDTRDYRHEVERVEVSSSQSPTESNLRRLDTPSSENRRGSDKNARQLLGELYVDKEYLEQLLNDKDFEHNPNEQVRQLVLDGLKYFDSRTEFWHQQKPIYARRKDSGGNRGKTQQQVAV